MAELTEVQIYKHDFNKTTYIIITDVSILLTQRIKIYDILTFQWLLMK